MPIVKKQRSTSASIPAPIGGWNARDSLGDMDQKDAVELNNFFPRTTDVVSRKGHTRYATGLPVQVESLISYHGAATQKLFAISNGSIYDVTAGGAVGAAVVTGLANSRWEYTNVATAGGNFVYAVNGIDKPLLYDGATWTPIDGLSAPAITGVTTTTLDNVNLFKTRLWFIQKNTLKVWYLPVNSVGGLAAAIDFQSIARLGGYLVSMATWTIDAGYGVDDLAAFITSLGEVIVYRGTDPASSATWALVGIWQIGSPLGKRCAFKWQGDILLITQDGLVPMSAALQSSRVNPRVALTDKIQSAVSNSATIYGTNFGWQIIYFASNNMLLLNVPVSEGSAQEQYVMNTITKSWARFTGMGANCWIVHNDVLYFGGNTYVGKAWDTYYDNGLTITGIAKQAFNYFGSRGQIKRWTMMRPVFQVSSGSIQFYVGLDVDFENNALTSLTTYAVQGLSLWDAAIWDQSVWSADTVTYKQWNGASGIGFCASPKIQTQLGGTLLTWVSTDLVMESGGIL